MLALRRALIPLAAGAALLAAPMAHAQTPPAPAPAKLDVKLAVKPGSKTTYTATITVTITDTCYKPGAIKLGLPPGVVGLPEIQYIYWSFTHTGKACGQLVRDVEKSIKVPVSQVKKSVTAYAVVNGAVAGEASQPAP